jgi:hypothetical protein
MITTLSNITRIEGTATRAAKAERGETGWRQVAEVRAKVAETVRRRVTLDICCGALRRRVNTVAQRIHPRSRRCCNPRVSRVDEMMLRGKSLS